MAAGRKREWFDNEAFWRELYPFLFPEESAEKAVAGLPLGGV
jgi:hypothetical protein